MKRIPPGKENKEHDVSILFLVGLKGRVASIGSILMETGCSS
jgi:hypothetical protein